ncbi:hypothetical protein MD484_g7919, partial [Candolleomyces efflorescens]
MVAPILPHFTKSQRTIILSFIDAFIAYLHEHNPKVVDRHPGTTAWMQNTASEIMKRDEFNAEKLGGRRPADVQKEICTYYRNFKNNNYKKKLTATTHSHPSESSPPSKLAITALKDTIRGLVVLESDLSARDIFFREADSDYRKVYKQVKSELPPETPAVVITQKAPKRAWNEADQELWETRKAQLELDCKTNQQSWPKFYRAALQQNLDRGIVGNAVIGVMYAFRDELDGLQHGILYAGYDAAKKDELRHQPQSHSDILKLWVAHADVTLPYSSAPPVCLFDCDDDGFPILPNIDIHEVVLRQVAELLRNYLSALWEHTYPPNTAFPTIPWAEIAKAPVDFIDTTLHNLPTALGCPVPCNPVHTLSLYDYLSKQQELGDPFRFRTKSDIDERRRIQAKEAVMELLKDDENLDIAQSDVDEQSKPLADPAEQSHHLAAVSESRCGAPSGGRTDSARFSSRNPAYQGPTFRSPYPASETTYAASEFPHRTSETTYAASEFTHRTSETTYAASESTHPACKASQGKKCQACSEWRPR